MVLEEASPTADTFTNSDVPQDDLDPYSSPSRSAFSSGASTRAALPPTIDLNRLPRPMPILGPLLGYGDSHLRGLIEYDAATTAAILQRPLTLPEWESAAFHMAKMESYASYGWPVGITWGLYRYRQTMHDWRFLFYKPDLEKIGRDRFNRFATLRGDAAQMAWKGLRLGIYTTFYGCLAKVIVTVYGVNVAIAGMKMDTRLRDFWQVYDTTERSEIMRRRRSVKQDTTATTPGAVSGFEGDSESFADDENGSTYSMELPPRQGAMQRAQQGIPPAAIPPGDQGVWERRRAAAARGELPMSDSARTQASESPDAADGGFDFDDASPMAREPPQQEARGGQQQESSWDRLRRGNGSQPQGSSNQQTSRPLQGAQGDAWSRVRGGSGGGGDSGERSL